MTDFRDILLYTSIRNVNYNQLNRIETTDTLYIDIPVCVFIIHVIFA